MHGNTMTPALCSALQTRILPYFKAQAGLNQDSFTRYINIIKFIMIS